MNEVRQIVNNACTHSGVALLGLLGVAGEDNEARLVRLETLDVDRLALLAQVSPPVVDDDADTTRLLLSNAGLLQFAEGEATALADFPVVAHSLGADGGAEEGEGADTKRSGLGLAGLAAAKFAAWLVEPSADTALPVLTEVVGVKDYRAQDIVQCRSKASMNRALHKPLLARKPIV